MTLAEAIAAGDVLAAARCYVAAGLSVIPVRADGSKAPAMAGWRVYTDRRPEEDELVRWFEPGKTAGIGVVPGAASGNLVVLDFESKYDRAAYPEWLERLPPDLKVSLAGCPVVRTPSGGRHVWVRLPEPTPGGRYARYAKGSTKVEVRGAGHQVLVPGCPGACHPTGLAYEFEQWGWLS